MEELHHVEIFARRQDSAKTVINVNAKYLHIEPELIELKHPEYAFMSPAELTREFRRHFTETYQRYHKKYKDALEAHKKLGLKKAELFDNPPSTINALWRARQHADALGLKYEIYLSLAFRHLLDKRKYQRLPIPNQLYSEHVIKAVEAGWAQGVKDGVYAYKFPLPDDLRFKVEHFSNEPAQVRYRQMQLDFIHGSRDREGVLWRLALLCFERETLPESVIENEFGLEIEQVRKRWDGSRTDYNELTNPNDLRRPCFGLPHAEPENKKICDGCLMKKDCAAERGIVSERVLRKIGTLDPHLQKKRENAAERKRRQRDREKQKNALSMV